MKNKSVVLAVILILLGSAAIVAVGRGRAKALKDAIGSTFK